MFQLLPSLLFSFFFNRMLLVYDTFQISVVQELIAIESYCHVQRYKMKINQNSIAEAEKEEQPLKCINLFD